MKKFYSEPELKMMQLELQTNIADLSLGYGNLGNGDEWGEGDYDGDIID